MTFKELFDEHLPLHSNDFGVNRIWTSESLSLKLAQIS
jgi:hypothetical protein